MTAYASFLYFGLLLYPVVPAILLGLGGWLRRWYVLLAGLLALAVQYGWESITGASGHRISPLLLLGIYALFSGGLVQLFALLRPRVAGKWLFWAALGLGLAPLALVKLLPLVGQGALVEILGFAGISYLTFRTLDAIIGIQDRLIKEFSVVAFWAYLLFLPTISAGPIDRYRRFQADWARSRTRAEYAADLGQGLHRIMNGFLYKFVLGHLIHTYWLTKAESHHGFWWLLSYMYAYSLYLFFDFAGYSHFAIGVSYLLGVHTPENFNRPFTSPNIREFWNRWHISLSLWFRDQIYMRFVMAATRGKWFRSRYVASYLGFLLTMGLMGLWHGNSLHYLVYGLYHGVLLAAYDWATRWNKEKRLWRDGLLWRWASIFVTFQTVCFGFLIFSGRLF